MTKIISNRFQIVKQIGKLFFYGKNIITDEIVFIKIQSKKNNSELNDFSSENLLKNEAIILNYIKKKEGFPLLKYYSSDNENYYLILSLLNKNLFQLKLLITNNNDYGHFSLQTVLHIGIQIIERIQYFHSIKLLHRDLKPHNIMIGFDNNSKILYLIDFGFAKRYTYFDENNIEKHIELRKNKNLIGTKNYASLNVLNGLEPSRRDDLESIFYTLLFLYLDNSTWNIMNNNFLQKELFIENLYEKMIIPKLFLDVFKYIRGLKFEEQPNYSYILSLFINNEYYSSKHSFEWN